MRRMPIALAAVLLSACSGGGHTSQPPPSSTDSVSTSISSSVSSSAPEPGGPGESEGGQREAEQQAREAEKQFYAQHVRPGGKPGQNFVDAQGPGGTAMDWYCGVVDGNFAGKYADTNAYTPNDTSTATPAFQKQTGKWDIGIEDEEKFATKNNEKACSRALKFFADLLSTPENGMRVSISSSGIWYYDFQYGHCNIDDGRYSRDDNSLRCGLDKKDWDANTSVFVAFVR